MYRDLSFSRYHEVIAAGEKEISASPDRRPAVLPPLCYAYYKVRRYDKIESCAADIEQMVKAGKNIHRDGLIMASDLSPFPAMLRASLHLDFGQYEKATQVGKAGLAAINDSAWGGGMMHPIRYRLEILPILGTAAALMGDAAAAAAYAKQIEDISLSFTTYAMANHKTAAAARTYMALGRCDKVLELSAKGEDGAFLRALGDAMLGGGSDSIKTQFDLSQSLQSGKCLIETGKTKEAGVALDYVIQHPRAQVSGEVYWVALFERGKLAELQQQFEAATGFYGRAVDAIEKQRSSIHTEAAKIGFVGDKQAVYERMVAALLIQHRAAEAFDYVERSKARALVDMLASKKDFSGSAVDPEKGRLILAQLDAADAASRMQATSADSGERGTRSLDIARKEIQQADAELSTLVTVTSVPPQELKTLIGEGESLVEYYYQGRDLYAFVLTRERLSGYKLNADGLADEVQGFRHALLEPGTAAWQEGARAVYRRLWQPIEDSIGARKVIVVPHGALHYLPFAALQDPNGKLLIDRYSIRLLPSASVLKFLRPSARGKEGLLLVLGNPDLGDPSRDLKFAEEEARSVAKLFPQSRLLVRQEASESNFKKAGGVFSRIHFATHGKFQADDPLNSGLYLAKDGENDGVLTVSELYSMKLDADLITLSACETGLGKVANGDDVVGLTRGFLYAGSRSIVASLWSVEDKATAQLMDAFYENLPKLSKQDALREAQLKTRQNFPHPFFWAAFQLTGRAD